MKVLNQATLGVAFGIGVLAFSTASVSAAVACRGSVCWHVQGQYEYPRDARVIIHPDDWHWRPRERFTWREHEGRGYWRGGHWIEW